MYDVTPSPAEHRRLHEHLTRDHGRRWVEIAELPLAALHRWEHVEHGLGLLDLRHTHPESDRPRAAADTPNEESH